MTPKLPLYSLNIFSTSMRDLSHASALLHSGSLVAPQNSKLRHFGHEFVILAIRPYLSPRGIVSGLRRTDRFIGHRAQVALTLECVPKCFASYIAARNSLSTD
ncbi:hypothetical protein TNCV_2844971 [Trichonephila clavipes]|nr:hypothetical protein TNCV_2844971 [Trichonephila clavipes]